MFLRSRRSPLGGDRLRSCSELLDSCCRMCDLSGERATKLGLCEPNPGRLRPRAKSGRTPTTSRPTSVELGRRLAQTSRRVLRLPPDAVWTELEHHRGCRSCGSSFEEFGESLSGELVRATGSNSGLLGAFLSNLEPILDCAIVGLARDAALRRRAARRAVRRRPLAPQARGGGPPGGVPDFGDRGSRLWRPSCGADSIETPESSKRGRKRVHEGIFRK